MPQRLFTTAKIPIFVEGVSLGVEKRKDGPVSVIVLSCKVQPFDAKLASSLDQGVGGDSNIRPTAFNLNTTEPKKAFTRHDFSLGLPRQRIECFATSDTERSRIALDGVRIYGTYVRAQKDMPTALALIFKASFGPVDRSELEYVYSLFRSQFCGTFFEADPSMQWEAEMEDDEEDEEGTDADVKARRPAPMFDTDEKGAVTEVEGQPVHAKPKERANRKLHVHHGGKNGKGKARAAAHR